MPTGYTYPVANGTVTDFPAFALSCARAFGALIMMRDEPSDAPIPDEFKPSDYNEKRLAEARARLAEIEAMSPAQVEASCNAEFEAQKISHDKYEVDQEAAERRLNQMLASVNAWEPPTAGHGELKSFMIEQLTISKRGTWRAEEPKKLSPSEWQQQQIEKLHKDVGYHAAEHAKELERIRWRNDWIKQLRASLTAGK